MSTILDRIVETKREETARLRRVGVKVEEPLFAPRPFAEALRAGRELNPGAPALIAELKKTSPSKGVLREDFDVPELARAYTAGGAAALSVLTDENYFQGHLANIGKAREVSPLPVLRKDFLIDPLQVTEARAAGADAVLLIAAILEGSHLSEMIACVKEAGLESLVEIHDGNELERALFAGAGIIGINNRNLKTFEVSLELSLELKKEIPADRVAVAESGIRSYEDAQRLAAAGFDAMLVGESLVVSADPKGAVESLLGKGRGGVS